MCSFWDTSPSSCLQSYAGEKKKKGRLCTSMSNWDRSDAALKRVSTCRELRRSLPRKAETAGSRFKLPLRNLPLMQISLPVRINLLPAAPPTSPPKNQTNKQRERKTARRLYSACQAHGSHYKLPHHKWTQRPANRADEGSGESWWLTGCKTSWSSNFDSSSALYCRWLLYGHFGLKTIFLATDF